MTMKDTAKVKTPMLDKARGVREESQKLGAFIEWMQENGLWIAEIHEHKGNEDEIGGCYGEHVCNDFCYRCRTEISLNCGYRTNEYYATRLSIEKILAKHFEIDLDKCEDERQALLDAINKPEVK